MTSSTAPFRRPWLRRAPLLAAIMLLGWLAGLFHAHHGEAAHRHCAVCVVAHAPAVVDVVSDPLPPPTRLPHPVAPVVADDPRSLAPASPAVRGPPAA
jgi:hypothetical protein